MAVTRTATKPAPRDFTAEVAFLTRALKAPTLRESVTRLAERARAESWSHEEFLVACLQREVSARESHGGEGRIRAARFPARKSIEEFDFDHARSLKRDVIAHLGTLDFVTARENVVFLGPPGTGKTHLAIGLAIRACQAGHRVLFATASDWVSTLVDAHHAGRLQAELVRLGRYPLLVVDEVGYIPFEPEAANLFFQLVSSRYERASLIVTSNKPFGRWGEVFGDDVVAAAMIDRLVHHAEVVAGEQLHPGRQVWAHDVVDALGEALFGVGFGVPCVGYVAPAVVDGEVPGDHGIDRGAECLRDAHGPPQCELRLFRSVDADDDAGPGTRCFCGGHRDRFLPGIGKPRTGLTVQGFAGDSRPLVLAMSTSIGQVIADSSVSPESRLTTEGLRSRDGATQRQRQRAGCGGAVGPVAA